MGDIFEELINDGYHLLWPLRLLSIEDKFEYVLEISETKAINQLNPTEHESFKEFYKDYTKRGYKGSLLFAPIEKNGERIITCITPDSNSAIFLYKLIGEKDDYCEKIIKFIKHDLDEVIVSTLSEEEQIADITNYLSEEKTGLIRGIAYRQKNINGSTELFQDICGDKIPIEYWKVRYRLFNDLFDKKSNCSNIDKLLLVIYQKGKTLTGYIFSQNDKIDKVEQICKNVYEKKITFFIKAVLPNKYHKLHVDMLIDKINNIGDFKFEKDQRNDEIKASISVYSPFKENAILLNEHHERLNLMLDLISLQENIGFSYYSKPQVTNLIKGHISVSYGNLECNPLPKPKTIEILTKSLQWKVSEKTKMALSALNKSITETYHGSALKIIWAACEQLLFDDDSDDRKQYFTKIEKNVIRSSLKGKIEKVKINKIISELGKIKSKTKNAIIKENVSLLFPEWSGEEVDKLIKEAFELRSKSVHTLVEREHECQNVTEKLKEILKRLINKEIGDIQKTEEVKG